MSVIPSASIIESAIDELRSRGVNPTVIVEFEQSNANNVLPSIFGDCPSILSGYLLGLKVASIIQKMTPSLQKEQ